jgi:hypothetical protein
MITGKPLDPAPITQTLGRGVVTPALAFQITP